MRDHLKGSLLAEAVCSRGIMGISKNEYAVLAALAEGERCSSQRDLARIMGVSLGTANRAYRTVCDRGEADGFSITEEGLTALEPYRVHNAVIMAAGLSSRFAPISYEKPKGVLTVRGEVLIERQIRQLKQAGIDDITVVVGYKKEHFFYLEDKFGVSIVANPEYAQRNNHSSLMAVADRLGNTYICSSDDYFVENPFHAYEWKAFYAVQYVSGPTDEWCVTTGSGGRLLSVQIGGRDSWIMLGHVYFDQAFSRAFLSYLREDYDKPETTDKLWESVMLDHIDKLHMLVKRYDPPIAFEFDSLDEVRDFDPEFLQNVDSEVFDNIARVLGCDRNDVRDVYPLKQGITNLSCHFRVGDAEYVYRHPGVGTEQLIDRNAEAAAQHLAADLGLDSTFIFEDPRKGWKISRFVPNCRELNPHDDDQLKCAMHMARRLHESGAKVERRFDFFLEGERYTDLLKTKGEIDIPGFAAMREQAKRLHDFVEADNEAVCLCHNDFFPLNFLLEEDGSLSLIDWEYAGMSDYASDFGTFVVCSQLSEQEAYRALRHYFDREPTMGEARHNLAFVGLAGWCWYVWSLYKEAEGDNVGEWLYIYYRYGKAYLKRALELYEPSFCRSENESSSS